MGYYSRDVLITLILMIVLGAGRTIAVKVFYQLGFSDPLLVTVLVLIGHALALPVYWILKQLSGHQQSKDELNGELHTTDEEFSIDSFASEERGQVANHTARRTGPIVSSKSLGTGIAALTTIQWAPHPSWCESSEFFPEVDEEEDDTPQELENDEECQRQSLEAVSHHDMKIVKEDMDKKGKPPLVKRGSKTGLTERSKRAVQWVHRVPWWAQPLLSSFFGVLDTAFRMLSVLYLAASVAEMVSGGLELVVSILASRIIRKRLIPKQRWLGAGVTIVGLVLIAGSDLISGDTSSRSLGLGLLFIILKVVTGVLKDISQEIFMQEAELSAMLLLGLEGLYGVFMALPLYYIIGPSLGYPPELAFAAIGSSALGLGYTFFLMVIVFLGGVYSILGTAVTSSMTRNMWKNFRGLVVWVVALALFYGLGNDDLGEEFVVPGSILILIGFGVMVIGLVVYYRKPKETKASPDEVPEVKTAA